MINDEWSPLLNLSGPCSLQAGRPRVCMALQCEQARELDVARRAWAAHNAMGSHREYERGSRGLGGTTVHKSIAAFCNLQPDCITIGMVLCPIPRCLSLGSRRVVRPVELGMLSKAIGYSMLTATACGVFRPVFPLKLASIDVKSHSRYSTRQRPQYA